MNTHVPSTDSEVSTPATSVAAEPDGDEPSTESSAAGAPDRSATHDQPAAPLSATEPDPSTTGAQKPAPAKRAPRKKTAPVSAPTLQSSDEAPADDHAASSGSEPASTTTETKKTRAKKTGAKPPIKKARAPKKTATDKRGAETDASPKSDTDEPPVKKRRATRSRRAPFEIAGNQVTAGKRMRMELPIGNLMSGTPVALPLIVVHGKKDGPVVWISAAIHGDEICGVEIIRQVLDAISAVTMAGTVIAAPVVNVHGFNTSDRYLPDRRDLNRSFPGSSRGSLASRIAHLFMKEIVNRSDVGIDLHTGADFRTNLPQIRCDVDNAPTLELAEQFGAPIIIDARLRDGSLRQAAVEDGKIMLLFEGGEANRFDPAAIAAGTAGVLRTLNHLGLTEVDTPIPQRPLYSRSTSWSRASNSGIVHLDAHLGELVIAKQQLATIYDPFGKVLGKIRSKHDGIVIGHTQAPLVNRGDALSHVARITPAVPGRGSSEHNGVDEDEDG